MAKVKKGSNPDGVVYVKLPPGLIDRLDNQIARGEFRSRSEGIREAVRDYLERLEDRQSGHLRVYVSTAATPEKPPPSEYKKANAP